jgi:hypothetical protein
MSRRRHAAGMNCNSNVGGVGLDADGLSLSCQFR